MEPLYYVVYLLWFYCCPADKEVSTNKGDQCNQKLDLTTFLMKPTLLHVQREIDNGPVAGITVLGSNVFVVRRTSQVYVYNSTSFTSRRKITIIGSKELRGIASCSHNNCLYVIDPEQKISQRM